MKKLTYAVLALTLIVVFTIVFSPLTKSTSLNPCACSSHPTYYQYLNILPQDSGTQIPSSLAINQTTTVSATIQNEVPDYSKYTTLSNVYVTLTSAFGHFSGGNSIYVGDLVPGTQTVSWQITGLSEGYDYFEIELTGINNHRNIPFEDSYYQLVTIGQPNGSIPNPPTTPIPPPTQPPIVTSTQTGTSQQGISQTNTATATPFPTASGSSKAPLEIQILSPAQDTTWLPQTNQTLTWTASGGKAPLNVTLAWSGSGSNGPWSTIGANLPANGSLNWVTTNGDEAYLIRATVQDSENSAQTATTQVASQTENTGLPLLPVALAITATAIVLVVIVLFKRMKAGKQKN